LQGPTRHLSPARGKRVGGVSERPTQDKAEGAILSTPCGSRRWKASGLRDGGALRGATLERGPWSVRRHAGVSSSAGSCTGDKRCSSGAEEGNVVGSRPKMRGHPTRGLARHSRQETRPSLGPKARARQSWLNSGRQNRLGVTRRALQRGRANLGNQEEPAPWRRKAGGARLVAHHRPRKGCSVVRSRKGRRSRPPSLRGSGSRGRSARTSWQLQKSLGGVFRSQIRSCAALRKGWRRE